MTLKSTFFKSYFLFAPRNKVVKPSPPETIVDGFNGYLAEAEDIQSMKNQMLRFLESPIDRENVAKATENMSWTNYAKAICNYE